MYSVFEFFYKQGCAAHIGVRGANADARAVRPYLISTISISKISMALGPMPAWGTPFSP